MIFQLIVATFHIVTVYAVSIIFEMGVYGPPLVMSFSNFLMFMLMALYTGHLKDQKLKEAWHMPTRASFYWVGIKDFMKIGIPSVAMLCVELWSFELMAMMAAMISVESIAV